VGELPPEGGKKRVFFRGTIRSERDRKGGDPEGEEERVSGSPRRQGAIRKGKKSKFSIPQKEEKP